ncbi:MAG: aminomethyl-transferring glycine dehydrogenase subunit GcvPB [Verrucomicrobiae bacterium]|nr:aminomethyl-transferring glycine dehydrogenase subunit GcvPB [Verrucomicrobiae bacterium]
MRPPLLNEQSKPGLQAVAFPVTNDPVDLPAEHRRQTPAPLPEVAEVDVVRHFTILSKDNFSVDTHFYPLGSCTMKYNPKVNEYVSALPGFAQLHPLQPASHAQGAMRLIFELEQMLGEICGMDAFTLQPAAGAHGELTGMLIARAAHLARGKPRRKVLVPSSAHGTNPASARLAGFQIVTVPGAPDGLLHPDQVAPLIDEDTAAIMLTNPNTLGVFEEHILEIARMAHEKGALLYYDGANLNALLGLCRPGDMGFDIVHVNLHKTFSTPHGGGGPGAGPVGVKKHLAPFLPSPRAQQNPDGSFSWQHNLPQSIGKMRAFHGNFSVLARAYAYIRALGWEGLRAASRAAIIHANYIKKQLEDKFPAYTNRPCMHECVLMANHLKEAGLTVRDIAKRILDYGYHAPTIAWPIHDCLMIEPTETESKETLDAFISAMRKVAREIETESYTLQHAPHHMPIQRVDEVKAARELRLRD